MKYIFLTILFVLVSIAASTAYYFVFKPYIFHSAGAYTHPSVAMASSSTSSHALTPVLSNQWYSSVYASLPTAPMYTLPLAVQFTNTGIAISYPQVTAKSDEIDAPFTPDITISLEQQLQKIQLQNVGDWHAQFRLTDVADGVMTATVGHGIPFVTTTATEKNIHLTISGEFTIKNTNTTIIPKAETEFQTANFLLQTPRASYIIILPKAEAVTVQSGAIIIPDASTLFIGLLDTPTHYANFLALSHTQITGTQAFPTIQGNTLQTQFVMQTNTGVTTLIALYPHQYDNLQTPLTQIGTYQTIRGPLHLVAAHAFTTTTPLMTPPATFTPLIQDYPDLQQQIHQDIQQLIKQGPPDSKDYYLGTWFGKASNLLLLADMEHMQEDKQTLLSYLEPIYLKSFSYFSYDKSKTSLIANKPEFGNEDLNDHHFHYGYYIRLGAIIASFDPSKFEDIKKGITPMVKDIATTTRTDTSYPFLRTFDIYESHSWADGYGDSAFGNNQESSSEAINAWYGAYLWSQVSHDTTLAQYALYLYNAEIIGAKYYWFDQDQLYTAPYTHAIASQVWSGKVTFSTWFSAETNMKYGIQLLPFTPASEYLASFKDFTPYQKDFSANDGNISKDWGDLFTMWQSFYDPKDALSNLPEVTKLEGNNSKSMMMYQVYRNKETQK